MAAARIRVTPSLQWRTGFANHFARRVRVLGLFLSRTRTEPTWPLPARAEFSDPFDPGKLFSPSSNRNLNCFQLFSKRGKVARYFLKISSYLRIKFLGAQVNKHRSDAINVSNVSASGLQVAWSAIEFSFMPDGSLVGNRR